MSVGPFSCEDPIDWEGMENEKKSKAGRAASLKEMRFREGVTVWFAGYCAHEENISANRKPESYEILWEDKINALIKIFFKPWKFEDDYKKSDNYRGITSTLASFEIVFVVKKSLNGLKETKGG